MVRATSKVKKLVMTHPQTIVTGPPVWRPKPKIRESEATTATPVKFREKFIISESPCAN